MPKESDSDNSRINQRCPPKDAGTYTKRHDALSLKIKFLQFYRFIRGGTPAPLMVPREKTYRITAKSSGDPRANSKVRATHNLHSSKDHRLVPKTYLFPESRLSFLVSHQLTKPFSHPIGNNLAKEKTMRPSKNSVLIDFDLIESYLNSRKLSKPIKTTISECYDGLFKRLDLEYMEYIEEIFSDKELAVALLSAQAFRTQRDSTGKPLLQRLTEFGQREHMEEIRFVLEYNHGITLREACEAKPYCNPPSQHQKAQQARAIFLSAIETAISQGNTQAAFWLHQTYHKKAAPRRYQIPLLFSTYDITSWVEWYWGTPNQAEALPLYGKSISSVRLATSPICSLQWLVEFAGIPLNKLLTKEDVASAINEMNYTKLNEFLTYLKGSYTAADWAELFYCCDIENIVMNLPLFLHFKEQFLAMEALRTSQLAVSNQSNGPVALKTLQALSQLGYSYDFNNFFDWYWALFDADEKEFLLQSNNFAIFRSACSEGRLHQIQAYWKDCPRSFRQAMLRASDPHQVGSQFNGLCVAYANEFADVVRFLLSLASQETLVEISKKYPAIQNTYPEAFADEVVTSPSTEPVIEPVPVEVLSESSFLRRTSTDTLDLDTGTASSESHSSPTITREDEDTSYSDNEEDSKAANRDETANVIAASAAVREIGLLARHRASSPHNEFDLISAIDSPDSAFDCSF